MLLDRGESPKVKDLFGGRSLEHGRAGVAGTQGSVTIARGTGGRPRTCGSPIPTT